MQRDKRARAPSQQSQAIGRVLHGSASNTKRLCRKLEDVMGGSKLANWTYRTLGSRNVVEVPIEGRLVTIRERVA